MPQLGCFCDTKTILNELPQRVRRGDGGEVCAVASKVPGSWKRGDEAAGQSVLTSTVSHPRMPVMLPVP